MSRLEVDLALSRRMVAAALDRAAQLGALVSAAVVDAGGHLVAFERMDGAEIAGPVLAPDKAFTAVAHRLATHELAELVVPGGPLNGMQAAAGGRYVCFAGGLPLWSEGRVVGGVGVSGGSAEEDLACASAASEVFTGHRGEGGAA
ncbi:MAG TPA: heme-binding protein [Actinomycetes bacterium]|nr:heme-binding protein [Actinomycetes bacterium]